MKKALDECEKQWENHWEKFGKRFGKNNGKIIGKLFGKSMENDRTLIGFEPPGGRFYAYFASYAYWV